MRPIRLSMQAFGPYANKVVVDFTLIGNKGLYLITGDTGAGKSTIFDGITYALYDKTSLENKEISNLRSKYAKEETITEVELTFLYDDKEYKIRRTPEYEYLTRNNTIGKKSPTVELTLPDGKVYTGKKKETDNKICEIIGIEYDQFRRIVMIAQGDFKELLLDKKGRGAIFRKIFDTSYLVSLQDKLNEERKDLDNKCLAGDQNIKRNIKEFYYDPQDDLNIELDEIKGLESYNIDALNSLVLKMNDKDEKQVDDFNAKLKQVETELTEVNQKVGAIAEIKKAQNNLEKAIDDKKIAEKDAKAAKENYEAIQKQKPVIEDKRKIATILEKELEQYADLNKRQTELTKVKTALDEYNKKQNSYEVEKKESENKLELNNKELTTLKDLEVDYQKIVTNLDNQRNLKQELEEFADNLSDYQKGQEKILVLTKEYEVVAKKTTETTTTYTEAYQLFLDNQAGILASRLVAHKPCPVCGSLEHPSCAKSIAKAPTEVELKNLKKVMEESTKKQEELSAMLNKTNGEVESSSKALKNQASKLLTVDDLNEAKSLLKNKQQEVDQLIKKLESQERELQNKQIRKKQLEVAIQESDKHLKEIQDKLIEIKQNIVTNEVAIKKEEKEIATIMTKLSFKSLKEAEDALKQLVEQINNFDSTLIKSEDQYKVANENVVKLEGLIKGYQDQLKDNKLKIDDSLETKQVELNAKKEELTNDKDQLYTRFSNNKKTLNLINKIYKETETIQKRREWIKALYDTASGKISGKKVSFETYIQMSYFDRILAYGNARLEIMTNGQYSFIRGEEGLDLNVIDHYNGTQREVSTLSGGESFMASLSLALGMSDEVQARATSIQIDALFVDEGFGSLDSESLNKAMEALQELSTGNRLVGIISHVDELKNRIDKKIIVTKDKANGSEISYEV